MKPSRYTFLIVPDNDGKNRQFAMSRKGTFLLLCSIIGIISGMVIALFILIPKSIDYQKMENRYYEVIEERIEVLELYRDLERMKQMELVVQKSLGSQAMINDNSRDIRKHYGIDIAVPIGEPILASASGQIVFAGWTTEFGNLIVIYHNNEYFTYYGHNELILVNAYDKVERGDVIATSGNSGISSGPHLHFEIWKDGVAVDPLSYFPELNKLNISVE